MKPFYYISNPSVLLKILLLLLSSFIAQGMDNEKELIFKKKFDSLTKLCRKHRLDNPQIALQYGWELEKMAKSSNDSSYKAAAYLNVAISYFYMNELDSCESYLLPITKMGLTREKEVKLKGNAYNVLCLVKKHKGNMKQALKYGVISGQYHSSAGDLRNYGMALCNIANILSITGDYQSAIDSSFKALLIFEKIKDSVAIISLLDDIANKYIDLGDTITGRKFLLRAKDMSEKIHDEYNLAHILSILGTLDFDKGEYGSALYLYKKALHLLEGKNLKKDVANIRQNIGNTQIKIGHLKDGLKNLFFTYHYFEKSEYKVELAYISKEIGSVYLDANELKKAEKYLLEAKILADQVEEYYLQHMINQYLYQLYTEKGNYQMSLVYFKQFTKEKDSVTGIEIKSKFIEYDAKYEAAIKEQKIKDLKYEKEKQLMGKKIMIGIFVGAILILLMILIFLLLRAKKNKEINLQKMVVVEKEKSLAKTQLEKEKILQQELQKEIQYKSKQLTTHALNMLQKNKLLQEMDEELKVCLPKMDDKLKKSLNSIRRQIKRNMSTEKDWHLFKLYFEEVNKNFLQKIQERSDQVTNNDLRLAALIKLNLNIKEAAAVLNIEPDSLKKARYRLRQKLNLDKNESLSEFINNIV